MKVETLRVLLQQSTTFKDDPAAHTQRCANWEELPWTPQETCRLALHAVATFPSFLSRCCSFGCGRADRADEGETWVQVPPPPPLQHSAQSTTTTVHRFSTYTNSRPLSLDLSTQHRRFRSIPARMDLPLSLPAVCIVTIDLYNQVPFRCFCA